MLCPSCSSGTSTSACGSSCAPITSIRCLSVRKEARGVEALKGACSESAGRCVVQGGPAALQRPAARRRPRGPGADHAAAAAVAAGGSGAERQHPAGAAARLSMRQDQETPLGVQGSQLERARIDMIVPGTADNPHELCGPQRSS